MGESLSDGLRRRTYSAVTYGIFVLATKSIQHQKCVIIAKMEMTNLERDILNWFKEAYPHPALSEQIEQCWVKHRQETDCGFFTGLSVPESTPLLPENGDNTFLNECKITSPELQIHAQVMLFISHRKIDFIEVQSIGDGNPNQLSIYRLEKEEVNYIQW
jgi:hypothetical protein